MISGAGPENAINSPNPGVFGAGGGGGGVFISCSTTKHLVRPNLLLTQVGTCVSGQPQPQFLVVGSMSHIITVPFF